jgi:hypothetical protein
VTPRGGTRGEAHQYGVPMKDFLLASVAVICADTPKSAKEKEGKLRENEQKIRGIVRSYSNTARNLGCV